MTGYGRHLKNMLLKNELLDRMELLFPYETRFADLRRAYIDRDLASIFRLLENIWDANFTDIRLTIVEKELHSLFRVWASNPAVYEDVRKATLEGNLWSLFRLFDPENESLVTNFKPPQDFDPQDLKKFVMNDNIWSMYRILLHIQDTQILKAIKSLHSNGIRWEKDAMSQGQLRSKMWLIDELKTLDLELGTVFLCAGWYGILATLMFEHDLNIEKIRSFDIDPDVVAIAEKFNLPFVQDEWKFKSAIADIHDLSYEKFSYTVSKADGSGIVLSDSADTIINTSCEHINNFDDWYAKIPNGKYIVLQSNNYHDVSEHVNISDSLEEFATQTPMAEVLYEGSLKLDKYTRWMRIGIK